MKIKKLLPIIIITLILLSFLFRSVIFKLNNVYFSNSGDGLKSYYCAYYHALYDSTATHFQGMNYPWGESMYFTDGQTPLSNAVRFIDQYIFPCAHKMVGVFNFMIIFSIFISIVFLFLILKKFDLPDWYALFLAFGISLLSPQMGRISGHFSLAWLCWIPIFMYLIISMVEKQSWLKTVLFALATLIASLMHMYFFLFAVALVGIYWFDRIFIHKTWNKRLTEIFHPATQIIVPFIIIQMLMLDNIVDRTNFPYGFMEYKGWAGAVFLPVYKWYVPFMNKFDFMHKYSWESMAYIGIVASIGFFLLIGKWLVRIVASRLHKFSITGYRSLDVIFWSSIPLLLLSFGIPFIWGLEGLQKHIGFLSQLRGLARFSWLFYYIINIVVWVQLYKLIILIKNKKIAYLILSVLLAFFGFESVNFALANVKHLDNSVPELSDVGNKSEINQWVENVDAKKYQAIMPLPYFHIGSESSWIEPKCDILKQMFIVSLKTGLPCNGVMLGRTSISQSYKNIEFCINPWEKYKVLEEFHSDKPLLLIVDNCYDLNVNEKRIVDNATLLLSTSKFDLFELQIDALRKIPNEVNYSQMYTNFIDTLKHEIAEGNHQCFIKNTGNLFSDDDGLKHSIEGSYNGYERILDAPVQFDSIQTVYLRFWIKDYKSDMVARTRLLIIQSNFNQNTLNETYSDIFRHIVSINNDWALVEIPLQLIEANEIIKLHIKNSIISCYKIYFDEFTVSGDAI